MHGIEELCICGVYYKKGYKIVSFVDKTDYCEYHDLW